MWSGFGLSHLPFCQNIQELALLDPANTHTSYALAVLDYSGTMSPPINCYHSQCPHQSTSITHNVPTNQPLSFITVNHNQAGLSEARVWERNEMRVMREEMSSSCDSCPQLTSEKRGRSYGDSPTGVIDGAVLFQSPNQKPWFSQ